MNLSYHICTLKDIDLLVEITINTFVTAFKEDNNPADFNTFLNSAFNKERLTEELLNPHSYFYFVFNTNTLIGYFKLNENEAQKEPFGSSALEIERIYVLSEFQGQQFGKKMLGKICEIARSKGFNFIWLGVWELNTAAIRFYQRLGFRKFDTHPFYLGNDKQMDWLMRLDLI
jgi:ribosomal protein S18 acetylase RimI-like enzyme